MGFASSQCSSRTASTRLRASIATLDVRRRVHHAMPAAKPTTEPSRPKATARVALRCPFAARHPNAATHAPIAAGMKAVLAESLRNGANGLPWRNSSSPRRAPSRPEFTSLRPYSRFECDHSRRCITCLASGGGRCLSMESRPCSDFHSRNASSVTHGTNCRDDLFA